MTTTTTTKNLPGKKMEMVMERCTNTWNMGYYIA